MLHRAIDIFLVVSHFNEYVSDYEWWRQKEPLINEPTQYCFRLTLQEIKNNFFCEPKVSLHARCYMFRINRTYFSSFFHSFISFLIMYVLHFYLLVNKIYVLWFFLKQSIISYYISMEFNFKA
jgi:hypothetical protein